MDGYFAEVKDNDARLSFGPRFLAAVWFAVTALIPVIFFLIIFNGGVWIANGDDGSEASFWIVIPICMAAFFGFTIGSRILDRRRVKNGFVAALLGALVAIASYVGMMTYQGVVVWLTDIDRHPDLATALSSWVAFVLLGALFVGWLIVIAGLLGGGLLYLWASYSGYPTEVPRVHRNAALGLNLLAGAVLLVAVVLCAGPVFRKAERQREQRRVFSSSLR